MAKPFGSFPPLSVSFHSSAPASVPTLQPRHHFHLLLTGSSIIIVSISGGNTDFDIELTNLMN